MAYVTVAEVRERVPVLADATAYPDAWIADGVAEFAELVENYRGVPYEPTTTTELWTIGSGRSTSWLSLSRPQVLSIDAITVDDVPIDPATYTLNLGIVVGPAGFTGQVSVTYTYGFPAPTARLKRACRIYVRATLLSDASGVSRDVITQAFEGGTTRYSTPDWTAGRPTGWLEVDGILNSLPDHRLGIGIG